MSKNHYRGSIQSSGRIGRPYRVEYVNRAGKPVHPLAGKIKNYNNQHLIVGKTKPFLSTNPKNKFAILNGKKPFIKEQANPQYKKPLPIKKTGTLFGGLKSIPTDPKIDPPPRACYNCWLHNHKRKDCLRPVTYRFCNNCGRRGVDLRTCPRCRQVYMLYKEVMAAKERGEQVNEQSFEPGFGESEFDPMEYEADSNSYDEIMQNLIQQDHIKRELLAYQHQEQLQEQQLLEEDNSYFGYNGNESFLNERKPSHQERHIGMAVYQEREAMRNQSTEPVIPEVGLYNSSSAHLYERDPEERARNSISPPVENNWQRDVEDTNSDPVQDILQLTKSISHLSPETQDLIMRQVIAERKEKARQRTGTHENEGKFW